MPVLSARMPKVISKLCCFNLLMCVCMLACYLVYINLVFYLYEYAEGISSEKFIRKDICAYSELCFLR